MTLSFAILHPFESSAAFDRQNEEDAVGETARSFPGTWSSISSGRRRCCWNMLPWRETNIILCNRSAEAAGLTSCCRGAASQRPPCSKSQEKARAGWRYRLTVYFVIDRLRGTYYCAKKYTGNPRRPSTGRCVAMVPKRVQFASKRRQLEMIGYRPRPKRRANPKRRARRSSRDSTRMVSGKTGEVHCCRLVPHEHHQPRTQS